MQRKVYNIKVSDLVFLAVWVIVPIVLVVLAA